MNRKDFIKSLVVGAAIAPAVVKAAEESKPRDWKKTMSGEKAMAELKSPKVHKDAIRIQCSGCKTNIDIKRLNIYSEYGQNYPNPMPYVDSKSTTVYGVSVSDFNSLLEAMHSNKEQFCVEFVDEKGWKNIIPIHGCIDKLEIVDSDNAVLEIIHINL